MIIIKLGYIVWSYYAVFQVYEIGEEGKDSIRKKELPSLRSLTSRNIYFFFSKITLSTFQRAVEKGVVDRREKNRITPKFLFEKILLIEEKKQRSIISPLSRPISFTRKNSSIPLQYASKRGIIVT